MIQESIKTQAGKPKSKGNYTAIYMCVYDWIHESNADLDQLQLLKL